jgi:hypothetical protein
VVGPVEVIGPLGRDVGWMFLSEIRCSKSAKKKVLKLSNILAFLTAPSNAILPPKLAIK